MKKKANLFGNMRIFLYFCTQIDEDWNTFMPDSTANNPTCTLFEQAAYFLLDHSEVILSNPRMYMYPVPFISGGSFCGPLPTIYLGAILEWWKGGDVRARYYDSNTPALILKLSFGIGGANYCYTVSPDGTTAHRSYISFPSLRDDFLKYVHSYQANAVPEDVYSLREILDLLGYS